ncbi:hypothetical protein JW698_02575 [Candidatus Wolfebacteria bacterium]|nr:hypothetical protein [Candidatus Wolfebacteria bacterium]
MIRKIFLATKNQAKIQRFKNLLNQAGLNVEINTPGDFGLENIDPEENGKDLAENAEIKARAYFGKVSIPILSNDTGFWVENEGLIDTPKRAGLNGKDEKSLTEKEVSEALLKFWKNIAKKHGGKVNAAWMEEFVLLKPDGKKRVARSKREVILTNREFGTPHIQMPIRSLYISKTTNKPAIQHTKEEEFIELKPIINALKKILSE